MQPYQPLCEHCRSHSQFIFRVGCPLAAKPAVLASLQSTKQCPTLRRMCGNSVCLPLTEPLIGANFAHEEQLYGRTAA